MEPSCTEKHTRSMRIKCCPSIGSKFGSRLKHIIWKCDLHRTHSSRLTKLASERIRIAKNSHLREVKIIIKQPTSSLTMCSRQYLLTFDDHFISVASFRLLPVRFTRRYLVRRLLFVIRQQNANRMLYSLSIVGPIKRPLEIFPCIRCRLGQIREKVHFPSVLCSAFIEKIGRLDKNSMAIWMLWIKSDDLCFLLLVFFFWWIKGR